MNRPVDHDGQHASAWRYADPRTHALLTATVGFVLQPQGFTRAQLAERVDALAGIASKPGRRAYDLRRLRLHGIVQRQPHSHRCRLTLFGLRTALFWTRSYARRLRPGMAELDPLAPASSRLQRALTQVPQTVENTIHGLKRASCNCGITPAAPAHR